MPSPSKSSGVEFGFVGSEPASFSVLSEYPSPSLSRSITTGTVTSRSLPSPLTVTGISIERSVSPSFQSVIDGVPAKLPLLSTDTPFTGLEVIVEPVSVVTAFTASSPVGKS